MGVVRRLAAPLSATCAALGLAAGCGSAQERAPGRVPAAKQGQAAKQGRAATQVRGGTQQPRAMQERAAGRETSSQRALGRLRPRLLPRRPRARSHARDAALWRSFSTLGRRRAVRDALPPRALEAITRGNAAHVSGEVKVSGSSARRVRLPHAPASWLLGTAGYVCLLHASPPPNPVGVVYSSICLTLEQAREGLLLSAYSTTVGGREQVLIEGTLPDGAARAALSSTGGHNTPLVIHDNAYAVRSRAPSAIRFRVAGAAHAVPVPLAPGSGGAIVKFAR
jgi:hypothetical protein